MVDFARLFGNADTKQRLKRAILNGTLPHALLVFGERGSGKRTLALEIASALMCKNSRGGSIPCGECINCKRVREGNHTDVKVLRRQSGKATVGVEEVRIFRDDMFLSPTEADCKVYIVEDADTLTAQSQNALLKVLEEPPSNMYLIMLTTSADKILSTIKSRTQYIAMQIHSQSEILGYLKSSSDIPFGVGEDKYQSAARLSRGLLGRAKEALTGDRMESEDKVLTCVMGLIRALPGRTPYSELYSALNAFPTKRDEFRYALEIALNAIRDLMVVRSSDEEEMLFFKDRQEAEENLASVSQKRLSDIFGILLSAIEDTDKNVLTSALITDLSLRIKQI